MNNERTLLLVVACMFGIQGIRAQPPNVTTSIGANAAAQALVGNNVTVSNATFSGVGTQLAGFTNGQYKVGFANGILLATGNAAFAGQMATSNPGDAIPVGSTNFDADLNMINGIGNPRSSAILEFDFMTTNNSISFDYVFASEEYTDYVGSNYNDAFGFFISGPGISGPFSNNSINIATINNSPVSVNTINHITNPNLFIYNPCCTLGQQNVNDPTTWVFAYNGQTVVLTAKLEVSCNTIYHAKIAICNTNDELYDSGVFIKQGTLTSTLTPPGPLTIAPSPVCAGEEITLTVQGDPTWNYTWSTGQSGVGLQTITTIASLDQNSYSVTGEYLSGCSLTTASPAALLTVHNPDNSRPNAWA